jgi:hypothetical protein
VKNKVCPARGENVTSAESRKIDVWFENAETGKLERGNMEVWPGDIILRPKLELYGQEK